jgi:epoxyqueuosine reductase QueG
VDVAGVAPAERFAPWPPELRPETLLAGARSVVVLGCEIFRAPAARAEVAQCEARGYRDLYDRHNRQAIAALGQAVERACSLLSAQGHAAVNVQQEVGNPSHPPRFSFKAAAVAAGVGVMGKNGLVLHPRFGSRIRLAAVITTAALPADPLLAGDPCSGCDACVRACPSGALREPGPGQRVNHDPFACYAYYVASGGCGRCMAACPR